MISKTIRKGRFCAPFFIKRKREYVWRDVLMQYVVNCILDKNDGIHNII